MAQAKKKTTIKTGKATRTNQQRSRQKNQKNQPQSNTFFLVSMSFLAATLLFANLMMLNA